ncbi:MAG: hypothetical protein GX271_10845 [Clostridiales bacterium]|nr:hypothetical protein [Clostridiales bacterium]
MKARYPIEAFALAMVVFSQNMKDALISGILILLITTLGLVLDQLFSKDLPRWSRTSCIIILIVSITHSLFQIVLIAVLGYEITDNTYIYHIFLGILIAKHIIDAEGQRDYNRLLLEGAGAYATLLIISIIREFMAEGAIHGFELLDFSYKSYGFSLVTIGFILSGMGIAILNRIFYKNRDLKRTESLLVIIPVIFLVQPFVIDSIDPTVSMVITIVITLVCFYSIRKYLVFSRLSKEIKNMPIELLSIGMIYMIFSMF